MLNIQDYCLAHNIWLGILKYVQDQQKQYHNVLTDSFTEDELLKMLKKNARKVLPAKEYDTFRKAITALKKGKTYSLKKENLYRLCYALELTSDTQAQNLFLNYLHLNELSARSLEEFIIIAALKLQLTWEEMCQIRETFQSQIRFQPISPEGLEEGKTAEVYQQVINEQLHSKEDLLSFLEHPENISFFTKTRNTQYLGLFDDLELEVIYNASNDQMIRLITNYGNSEKETIQEYYFSLFGLQSDNSDDSLSENEISLLGDKFEDVFMSYDNFCALVQRKRPVDISSGIFMLSLLKKLLTDDADTNHDFYVNFMDPEEFIEICNDILIYFGLPALNPKCDSFDHLLLDVYHETLNENPTASNSNFQQLYIANLRNYLRKIAAA